MIMSKDKSFASTSYNRRNRLIEMCHLTNLTGTSHSIIKVITGTSYTLFCYLSMSNLIS